MNFNRTRKQPKNIAMQAFPEQFAKLRPEAGEVGGVKARSAPEEQRMAVYRAIRDLFLAAEPKCQVCANTLGRAAADDATEVHHCRGREGLLLFDVRHFAALCRSCHAWVHANPDLARAQGYLPEKGEWGTNSSDQEIK